MLLTHICCGKLLVLISRFLYYCLSLGATQEAPRGIDDAVGLISRRDVVVVSSEEHSKQIKLAELGLEDNLHHMLGEYRPGREQRRRRKRQRGWKRISS